MNKEKDDVFVYADNELAQEFGYESAEDYKCCMAESEELRIKSEKLHNKQPKEWPTIKIN